MPRVTTSEQFVVGQFIARRMRFHIIGKVITVSLETVDIINNLPALEIK